MGWWIVLYYPIIFAIMFIGYCLEKRYAPDSVERKRAEMGLGCGLILLPSLPLIIGAFDVLRYLIFGN